MGRDVLASALEVVAEAPHQVERVGKLEVGVEAAIEDAVVDRVGVSCNVRHQGNDRALQLGEDRLELCCLHAGLAPVEQRVVGSVCIAERVRDAPVQLDVLLEVRLEDAELLVFSRFLPRGTCEGAGAGGLGDQVGRELALLVVVATGDPDEAGLVGVIGLARHLVLELGEELADPFRSEADVGDAEQGGELVGATLDAARRHVGLLVPFEDRRGPIDVRDLGQDVLELLQMVVRGAHPCGYSPEWACRPARRPASSVDRASVF